VRDRKVVQLFQFENLCEREQLEELGIGRRVIIKSNLRTYKISYGLCLYSSV